MNDVELFARAREHLIKVSALIQPKAEPGSAIPLEEAFVWNHANNVAMLAVDFQILIEAESFSGPILVARTMIESALILSAGVTNRNLMREKLDYDLRQNFRRLEQAEKELGSDLTKEKQFLREHLKAIRDGSTHNQNEKLDFLQIAKRAKCDSTAAYRNYYYIFSFHVHADWLAFTQTVNTSGAPTKAVLAATFACAVAVESLLDFYPRISTKENLAENLAIWRGLGQP
jgi:hypothetical protein